MSMELLQMSMHDKPRRKNQKYRLTEKGRVWLAEAKA
jgi:DNA-binding PadR family transcriptional regulator